MGDTRCANGHGWHFKEDEVHETVYPSDGTHPRCGPWCRVVGSDARRASRRNAPRVAYEGDEFRLQPGVGFYLKDDGNWGVADIPDEIVREARFSGYLTIQGYRCIVFEYAGQQWAQKATGTVASLERIAARIAGITRP